MMPTAAWLVASALFGPDLTGASYRELVLRYAKGERAAAVAELGAWSEKDLARELGRLRSWERRARQCQACEEKYTYPRFPLRAAVLLHTDREELERRSRSPVDEATPRCGIGPQGVIAKEIAPAIDPVMEFAMRDLFEMIFGVRATAATKKAETTLMRVRRGTRRAMRP